MPTDAAGPKRDGRVNDGALMDAAMTAEWDTWVASVPCEISSMERSGFEYGFELGWRAQAARIAELEAKLATFQVGGFYAR